MLLNYGFAREVGYLRYIIRRILWRIAPPASITLPTGMEFLLPKEKVFSADVFVTEGNLDWNAEYILIAFLKSLPERGDFLDVGAHIGYYSALLRPYVSRIYAFEPDVRNHPFLRAAFSSYSNTEIIPEAVADQPGSIVLCQENESSISHIDPAASSGNYVPVTTIDEFCARREVVPSAIKIDIEGYDILAIRGASGTAQRHSPVFVVEYNQDEQRPNTWEALQAFALEHRYNVFAASREKIFPMDYQYTFRSFDAPGLAGLDIKMLFLVPQKHKAWFDRFVEQSGNWTNKDLRRPAVRRMIA